MLPVTVGRAQPGPKATYMGTGISVLPVAPPPLSRVPPLLALLAQALEIFLLVCTPPAPHPTSTSPPLPKTSPLFHCVLSPLTQSQRPSSVLRTRLWYDRPDSTP